VRSEIPLIFVALAQENSNQTFDPLFVHILNFFSPPSTPFFFLLPGNMDTFAGTLREWLSMHIDNGARLVRLLNILYFILENIFDSFSGRHWAFLCSSIHAAFSGHFEPVANFFVPHPSTSIFLFSSSLPNDALDQFINDFQFVNGLLRELIRFTTSRDCQLLSCYILFFSLLLISFLRYYLLSS